MSDDRVLSERDREVVTAAGQKAYVLYEGKEVGHHSCGIAIAATFELPTPAYQSLRRGGITGCGTCGAIRAGEQVIGEILGDPDPTGAVTDELRAAARWYQEQVAERVDRGSSPDLICNHLTAPLGDFHGSERFDFCTRLSSQVATITAEALVRFSRSPEPLSIRPVALPTAAPRAADPAAPENARDIPEETS